MKKILLSLLSVGMLSAPSFAQLRGLYAPSNWTYNDYGSGSTYSVAPNGSSITFNMPAYGEVHYSIMMPQTGQVSYSFSKSGDVTNGYFGLADNDNGIFYTATGTSGSVASILSYPIHVGQPIEFYGSADQNPFSVTVSSFNAPGVVPLPVTLTYFGVSAASWGNLLTWNTAMEQSLSSFRIERSENGKDFAGIGVLSARNQPGNYSFQDKITRSAPVFYYRLTVVNTDGSTSYSNTVSIHNKVATNEFSISAYPNPATDAVNLNIREGAENGRVTMCDITGNVIREHQISSNGGTISLESVPAGIYFLKYQDAKHSKTLRIQVQ